MCFSHREKKGWSQTKEKFPGRLKAGAKMWTRKIIEEILPKDKLIEKTPLGIPQERIINGKQLPLCKCGMCNNILSQPIMLTKCQHVFCYCCIVPHLMGKYEHDGSCPVCNVVATFQGLIIPSYLNNLIKLLIMGCATCKKEFDIFHYMDLQEHEADCHSSSLPTSEYCLKDVFLLNENSEIPRIAEDAALHIIKAKLKKDQSTTSRFKSGGPRPNIISLSTAAFKESENVSKKTLRRRTIQMQDSLGAVAGSSRESMMLQTGLLVKTFNLDERKNILEMAKIERSFIDAESVVAMKADLSMPWEKMKAMSRWLKMFNVSMASNAKQRIVAKQWHGDNFTVEEAPFTFPVKDRRSQYKICSAPLAYVKNFPAHVKNLLDLLDENGLLLFESDSEDVHIKIGGDHGGDSFKQCFQVVNVKNPNSKENTMVFSMFEAKDYRSNLEIALKMYYEQIHALQSMTWKNRNIKVFLCGDYQYLCMVSGLTGANGRHCCLWCLATKEDLKNPNADSPLRTVESMIFDSDMYVEGGSVLKNAKLYNNMIYRPLFDIPLEQIVPPGLHISLGTYLKYFNLLEEETHRLDLLLAEKSGETVFTVFTNIRSQIRNLLVSIEDKEQKIILVRDAAAHAILLNPDNEQQIKDIYEPRLQHLTNQIAAKQEEVETLKASEAFKECGPCENVLDKVLKSLTVARQAYHGKSFIGNHVHVMLKPESINKLCDAIIQVVHDLDADVEVLNQANLISSKYKRLFTKYVTCHNMFNSSEPFNDVDINILEVAINDLLSYFREEWPDESITPKLHILEKHIIPFIKRWHYGMGKYGEQGGEGIHAEFNSLTRVYCRMRSNAQRVESMLKEHSIRTHPLAKKIKPMIKRRKVGKDGN